VKAIRVIIVDDFAPLRMYIRELLDDDSELEVLCVSADGADAVLKCEELQPDVVVLDISLPQINGFEAARQIKAVSPETKIVFLSTHESAGVMREALIIGAGYVVKRHASRDLLPTVRAAARDKPLVRFRFADDGPKPTHS
jgi:DNA-binding NarL/FixJ family response regulator